MFLLTSVATESTGNVMDWSQCFSVRVKKEPRRKIGNGWESSKTYNVVKKTVFKSYKNCFGIHWLKFTIFFHLPYFFNISKTLLGLVLLRLILSCYIFPKNFIEIWEISQKERPCCSSILIIFVNFLFEFFKIFLIIETNHVSVTDPAISYYYQLLLISSVSTFNLL